MEQLPPLPPGVRSLTDPESSRLRQQNTDLWINPQKSCLTCSKQGSFKARSGSQIVDVECRCVDQWKLHRWLLNAGVGLRYQRISWVDAVGVPANVQMAVLEYVDQAEANIATGTGLTLWSPDKGTGKSMLATLLIKALLAKGNDCFFIQFNEMLNFFSDGWRDKDEREWFTRKVRNAGVLGVDDMGREYKGRAEVAEAMFDTVIRARVASARPTIITTNYTPEQMLAGYGGNILSLLSEVNTEIHVPGQDFRPRARERLMRDRADGILTYPITVG